MANLTVNFLPAVLLSSLKIKLKKKFKNICIQIKYNYISESITSDAMKKILNKTPISLMLTYVLPRIQCLFS
jgi:hypothetical protein